ncbi:hypothetical protein D9M68_615160 [compost metagenome]
MQTYLAKMLGGFLVGKGLGYLLQRIAAVDNWPPAEVFQRTHHVLLLLATADDQAA